MYAQGSNERELFHILKEKDSILFHGFNTCNTVPFEQLISDNFEFYHDEGGVTSSKAAFIDGFKKNVCSLNYKARRELVEGSLEVYPLKKNGVLYGAVQTGRHRFYAIEKDKPEYLTSVAKFTNLWQLEHGEWKLSRTVSYDHQDDGSTVTSTPEFFEDRAKVNAWIKENKVPGLAIGYIHDGQLQQISVYGDLDSGRPAPYNAVFNVASFTKTVTAYIALKLASAGEWDLDEPLYHYWIDPDIKDDPRSKKLTTRNILNQESGFPNWRWELKDQKLAFVHNPGTTYEYSGEGFEYLRHALENKFHKALDVLASELVFQPLGMKDSRMIWDSTLEPRFAVPHDADGAALPITKNTHPNGADLLKTTIADYGTFLLAILHGEGLSKKIAEQMVKPTVLTKENRYIGLCWFLYMNVGDGEYALSHGGDDPGVHSICFLLPKSKEGLVIFTNSDNGPRTLFADIIKAYLKEKGQAIIDIEMK